jgi:hypothetical protein
MVKVSTLSIAVVQINYGLLKYFFFFLQLIKQIMAIFSRYKYYLLGNFNASCTRSAYHDFRRGYTPCTIRVPSIKPLAGCCTYQYLLSVRRAYIYIYVYIFFFHKMFSNTSPLTGNVLWGCRLRRKPHSNKCKIVGNFLSDDS